MRYFYQLLLIICFSSLSVAQTADPDYLDGVLLFKTLPNSGVTLPEYPTEGSYPYFDSLIVKYGVVRIKRTFPETLNPHHAGMYKVAFSHIEDLDAFVADLQQYAFMEFACGEPIYKPLSVPDDRKYPFQWAYSKIMANDMWPLLPGMGKQIKIAVIDDAVLLEHEDIYGIISKNSDDLGGDEDGNGLIDTTGYDFAESDPNVNPPTSADANYFSHGTHVAGIAAAVTNNGEGIASLNYNGLIKIIPIKVARDSDPNAFINIYDAIVYAIDIGADVINMSFGRNTFNSADSALIASSSSIIFVAGAGNDGNSLSFYPASYEIPNLISVAATHTMDERAVFSNFNAAVDVSAPGSGILSTVADGGYGYKKGTSMATPLVSGLCAALWSYDSTLTALQVVNRIINTADNIDFENPNYIGMLGSGRINALRAFLADTPFPYNANFRSNRSTSLCTGDTAQFEARTYSGVTYFWEFGDGQTASSSSPVINHIFTSPGNYTVTLSIKNSLGHVQSKASYNEFIGISACTPISDRDAQWIFGDYAEMDFRSGRPVSKNNVLQAGTQKALEGSFTVCDDNGNLLFYGGNKADNSNYLQIYDRFHQLKYTNYNVIGTPTQGFICLPLDGSFYLVVTTTNELGQGLRYIKIDSFATTFSEHLVTETSAGIPFAVSASGEMRTDESITAIPDCTNSGYWVFVMGYSGDDLYGNSDKLFVFRLYDSSGVIKFKYQSSKTVLAGFYNTASSIKTSPDGKFLTLSNNGANPINNEISKSTSVFSFDKAKGKLDSLFTFNISTGTLGFSFSPDSRLLYVTEWANAMIHQLNLYDPEPMLTKTSLLTEGFESMKLAPDGKIYLSAVGVDTLGVIDNPNNLNYSDSINNCGFRKIALRLYPGTKPISRFNNSLESTFSDQITYRSIACMKVQFFPPSLCDTIVKWYFGDGDSSTLVNPIHQYATTGRYLVTLIAGGTTYEHFVEAGITGAIEGDTAICDSSAVYIFKAKKDDYYRYQWSMSNGEFLTDSTKYMVETKYAKSGFLKVVVTDLRYGCKDSSQVQIVYGSIPGNRISLDSQPCIAYLNGTTLFAGVGTTSYQWQFGKDTSSLSNLDTLEDMSYFVQTDSLFFRRVASNAQCEAPSNWLKVLSKPQINVSHVIPNLICDGDTLSYIDKHQVSLQNWDMNPVWIQVYEKPLSAGFYTHLDSFLYERDTILEIPIVLGDSLYFGIETDCGFVTSRKFGVPFGEKNNIISLTDPACFPGAVYSAFGSEIDNNSPLNYEWQWSSPNSNLWQVISSSDSSIHLNSVYSYNFRNVLLRRIVSDSSCSSTSDTLNVFPQLFITSHPQDISSCSGDGNTPYIFRFEVEANPQRSYTAYLMARKFVSPFGYIYLAVDSVHHVSYLNEMDSVVYTPDATTDSFFFRMVTSCGYYDSDTAKRFPCNSTSWTVSSPDTMYTTEDSSVQMIAHLDLCSGGPVLNGAYTYWQHSANGTNWYLLNDTCGDTLRFRASSCDNGLYYRMAFHTPCQPSDLYSPVIRLYVTQTNFAKLMMRDYWDDNGTEPNYTTDWRNLYSPPSLIIRKNADGGTTPELPDWGSDTAVYVYYTIRNADNSDTSKPAKLKMYWTSGGPNGADWPIAWRDVIGNRFVNLDPGNDSAYLNTYPYGDLINEIPIDVPPIAPGDSIRTYFKWNSFPNPLRYYTKVNGSYVYDNPRIMCLLARIETCPLDSFGMSYKEISATRQNIINNRKIVARNMTVTNLHWVYGKKDNFPLTVRRFEGDDEPIRLVLAQVGTCSFGSFGRIRVTLSDNLWDAWVAGGYTGSGYSIVSTNILEVTNISAFEIRNIDLDPGYVESMDVEYELTSNPLGSYSCQFTLAQYQGNSAPDPYGAYVMGVNFQGVPDIGIGGKVEKPEEKNATVPDSVSTFNEQQERGSNKPISTNSEFVRAGSLFAYPNPFNNEVKFFFELIGEHRVGFEVYNGFGALVGQIEPQRFSDGNHKVDFNGSHLAPGLYHCKITIDNEIKILRLIIAR